ncbi:MAG: hypothetical protein L0220_20050, partial [Acidobacteria bacterium]|nr:hypothetical protein [Acidobacteriota bacterium]
MDIDSRYIIAIALPSIKEACRIKAEERWPSNVLSVTEDVTTLRAIVKVPGADRAWFTQTILPLDPTARFLERIDQETFSETEY